MVDILATDGAFRSTGSGTWCLVDASYAPRLRTRFRSGGWIVHVDIAPGVYTSPYGATWARLRDFRHEEDSIIAHSRASYDDIVEIKSSDEGFATLGNWKKVS